MISKKLYTECVKTLINFNKRDAEIYDATNGMIDFLNCEELSDLIQKFTELLEYCSNDTTNPEFGSNLQYFLYDLEGGKRYTPGQIKDDNGDDIPCKNVEDLWNNFIVSEHPEIEDIVER